MCSGCTTPGREIIQQFSLSDEHELLHGAPYTQLHRAEFHALLAAKARDFKPDVIRLDRRVVGFSEAGDSIELKFADGSSARGDLLIGADGLKSVVRGQIVGDVPAIYTGDAAWRVTVPVDRLPSPFLPHVMSVFIGPGGHAVCYYVRGGKLLNFVGIVETDDVSENRGRSIFRGRRSRLVSEAGIRSSRPSSMRPTRISAFAGRYTTGRRFATGALHARRCSAIQLIQRCLTLRRAPSWRSRTARC